jgi:hypothetical protein
MSAIGRREYIRNHPTKDGTSEVSGLTIHIEGNIFRIIDIRHRAAMPTRWYLPVFLENAACDAKRKELENDE